MKWVLYTVDHRIIHVPVAFIQLISLSLAVTLRIEYQMYGWFHVWLEREMSSCCKYEYLIE